ncbi:transcriptional regulator family: HMG [Paecilomyces variotii]|nr:transcriptional regulator family: HMG [Paecilomyces variotii]KAJ9221108.1 transcriptional regulator family: HMG [Paecilomyces variotii]KAJ9234992.1 transcriptional regulator family: HMG [Paecilomyces variotii]KAJ9260737.1 transcriptional regulator family: HMG [Paecilomyces variotii]KAJ9272380.1 transcriptional regulator family: HMG [Paecilomyces variotii]
MSRKEDSKAKDAIVTVNIDDFTRTRDSPPGVVNMSRAASPRRVELSAHDFLSSLNHTTELTSAVTLAIRSLAGSHTEEHIRLTQSQVIVSLATLQSAVSDLSRAYINHANTVLNRGPSNLDIGGITGGITSSLLENGLLGGGRHASPGAKSEVGEKKKRKRAPHDPNAPKRALTPYFLYMQHNRAQIASELGSNARPKEVADEGTRRWSEMPDAQKEVWKKLYADNLAVYKEKMKAYKAGLPVPEDDSAKAANQLQQDVAAGAEPSVEESEESEQEEEEEEDEDEEEESSPEPVKEPTPPRSGKRRRTGENIKPVASPVSKKASPEKKPKRGAAIAAQKKEEKETPKETPTGRKSIGGAADNKRGKKKRKSEAADE